MSADTDDLLFKYVSGEATEAERAELRKLVEADPKLAARLFSAAELEQDLAGLAVVKTKTVRPTLRSGKSRRIKSSRRVLRMPARSSAPFWSGLAVAGILVAVAVFALSKNTTVPTPQVVTARAIVRIESVSGDVAIVSAAEQQSPAKLGAEVLENEGVQTGPQGSAVLVYVDGTRLDVRPNTRLEKFTGETEGQGKTLRLSSGKLQATVAKQPAGRPFLLRTANAEAEVLGTILNLSAASNLTRLEVVEGRVRLTKDDKASTVVSAGHSATAMAGKELRSTVLTPLDKDGTVTINFGPAGMALPPGVLNDSGEEFDSERGYGWDGPKVGAPIPGATYVTNTGEVKQLNKGRYSMRSNKVADVLRDSTLVAGWANSTETWRMPCENGKYLVTVCVGEFYSEQGPHHVRVEDQQIINAEMTASNEWIERKDIPVEVKDGELKMVVGGHGSKKIASDKSSDTTLNFIRIQRVNPTGK